MENSVINKKAEISDLLKEFKGLISLHSNEVAEYLKDEHYFPGLEDKLNGKDENDFHSLKLEHCELDSEFRQFVMKYNMRHDAIKETTLDNIIKIIPNYILHEQPIDNKKESMDNEESIDSDLEEETIDDEEAMDDEETIGSDLKESTINNLEQPTINNNLTVHNNILKEPTINNKESLISDILKQSMINNILRPTISYNSKELMVNNILKQ